MITYGIGTVCMVSVAAGKSWKLCSVVLENIGIIIHLRFDSTWDASCTET